MSIVAIGLNILLAALLGAALWMGARLNGRLRVLRDSHEGFAKAVGELNAAAARAERGLADLRAASDEASELLGVRIEAARNLAAKLDRQVQAQPALTPADADDRTAAERRFGALLAAVQQPRKGPEPRLPDLDLAQRAPRSAREERLDRFAPRGATPIPTPTPAPAPAPRARPMLDDDLFDEPAPLARLGTRR